MIRAVYVGNGFAYELVNGDAAAQGVRFSVSCIEGEGDLLRKTCYVLYLY